LFISSFGILFFSLSSNNDFFLKDIEESESAIKREQSVLDDAKSLKSRIKTIEKVKKDYIYWSKFDYIMRSSTPEGVYLTSLEFDDKNMSTADDLTKKMASSKNKIKLIGYGRTKNDIGIFRDALAKQTGFLIVNIENIKVDDSPDIGTAKNNFTMSFILDDNVIKKGEK
jgi:Tfp pilus assembly protein PilN